MRKNMAPSKTQHHRIRFWINNQAYNIYKRDTTFWETRNPTSMKSNTYTDEARFTVQVGRDVAAEILTNPTLWLCGYFPKQAWGCKPEKAARCKGARHQAQPNCRHHVEPQGQRPRAQVRGNAWLRTLAGRCRKAPRKNGRADVRAIWRQDPVMCSPAE